MSAATRESGGTREGVGLLDEEVRTAPTPVGRRKERMLIVQPRLTSYRIPFFRELAESFEVELAAPFDGADGFKADLADELGDLGKRLVGSRLAGSRAGIYWQTGILGRLVRFRPGYLLVTADFRSMAFWAALLFAPALRVRILAFGHGVFQQQRVSAQRRVLYRLIEWRSWRYLCYNELVRESLLRIGYRPDNLWVLENVIENHHARSADAIEPGPLDLVFIGRLRQDSCLDLLFDALQQLGDRGHRLKLHLIGGGQLADEVREEVDRRGLEVTLWGPVYDDGVIAGICGNCGIGVYPGNSGLSVVHYMSFGLVPITHDELRSHSGPEVGYIRDGENGLLFRKSSAEDLARKIEFVVSQPEVALRLRRNAAETYRLLTAESMAARLIRMIREN